MMRRIPAVALTMLSMWAYSPLATAQPAVSAVAEQVSGGVPVLVISGSRFGTRGDFGGSQAFLNAGWTNFESGLETGNFGIESGAHQWSLDPSGPRPNSRYSAKKVYIDSRLGELNLTQNGTTGKWFVSFYMQTAGPSTLGGKEFRIYGTGANMYLATGNGDNNLRGYSECTTCSPGPTTVWGTPDQFVAGRWHRVDIEMAKSPDWVAVYLDGKVQFRRSTTLSGSEKQEWIPASFSGNGHSIGVGNMIEGAGSYFKFDDVYIDYTYARVELGDAPTWSACTRREIQVPLQWADGQVRMQLNKGAFSTGNVAYVYVVDGNGSVNSSGFPITIGGGGVPPPPAPTAPTNLRVVL